MIPRTFHDFSLGLFPGILLLMFNLGDYSSGLKE
jgi:hypothetical protein